MDRKNSTRVAGGWNASQHSIINNFVQEHPISTGLLSTNTIKRTRAKSSQYAKRSGGGNRPKTNINANMPNFPVNNRQVGPHAHMRMASEVQLNQTAAMPRKRSANRLVKGGYTSCRGGVTSRGANNSTLVASSARVGKTGGLNHPTMIDTQTQK